MREKGRLRMTGCGRPRDKSVYSGAGQGALAGKAPSESELKFI